MQTPADEEVLVAKESRGSKFCQTFDHMVSLYLVDFNYLQQTNKQTKEKKENQETNKQTYRGSKLCQTLDHMVNLVSTNKQIKEGSCRYVVLTVSYVVLIESYVILTVSYVVLTVSCKGL